MPHTPTIAKLTAPKIGRVLTRPRLLEQLDKSAHQSLTWIAAAAGSGKTTLAIEWLTSRKRMHLWYQIDVGDQDIATFFNYLASSAERASSSKGKITRFTPEYSLGLPAFCRNFFRALFERLTPPMCIVFDNYQDVGNSNVLDSVLVHALDELPDGISLIVLSRITLPAAFARHETNGHVTLLDADALNLTSDEETAVVNLTLTDRQLMPAELSRLHQATRGWMAGLLVVLREIKTRAKGEEASVIEAVMSTPKQNPIRIFDYFASVVLARLDASTREFLYATALFPAMSVSLCELLTKNQQSKIILQRLVNEHFFTFRRGLPTVSYEFHPLFRQFLLAQAEVHLEHTVLQAYRRQAGRLLAEAGESDAAVELLSAAEDWVTITEIIHTYGPALEKQGRLQTLQQWIAALPCNVQDNDPWLLYWTGIVLTPTNPFAAYELFARAYPQFSDQNEVLGLYQCWIGATTALYFRHDDMNPVSHWIAELEQLRARYPDWPSTEVQARITAAAVGALLVGDAKNPALQVWVARTEEMYNMVTIGALRCFLGYQLGMYYSMYGHNIKLTQLAEQLQLYIASPKIPDIARFLAASIPVYAAWKSGDQAEANAAIAIGFDLLEASGVHVVSQWFLAGAAIVKSSYCELVDADKFMKLFRKNSNLRHRSEQATIHFMASWRALLLGEFAIAQQQSEISLAILEPMHSPYFVVKALGANIQANIELGEFAKARIALENLRNLSQEIQNEPYSKYYVKYLESYLLDRSGGSLEEILHALQLSFSIGAQQQWFVTLFWQPRLIARLCTLALQYNIEPDYAKQLIRTYHLSPPSGELISQWPWPYRIHVLGRFSVIQGDQALTLPTKGQKKPMELLKVLIALGGREVSQLQLTEALWPDAEGDAGQQAFEVTLHRLRKILGENAPLQFKDGRLTLDGRRCWVDVWAFERLLSIVEADLRSQKGDRLEAMAHQLFALYQGGLFTSESELPVSLSLRERLSSRFLRILKDLGNFHETLQAWDQASICYLRALEVEPLAEVFYQKLMHRHHVLERYAEGLAIYERCRKTLRASLAVDPSRETETLRQNLMDGSSCANRGQVFR